MRKEKTMTTYILPLSPTSSIKIWSLLGDTAVVQYYSTEKKSRKSACKVKTYNDKRYITCLGHRYYLDKFTKVEL